MAMELVVLGTSCSNPTVERNLTAVGLRFEGNWYLFDCPEGTQRQMMKAGASYMRVNAIFLSHFHADHILGLPGLIATMSMHGRDYPLHVIGPKGTEREVQKAMNFAMFKKSFEIKVKEVNRGLAFKGEKFTVEAFPLKHDVPCLGFAFKENDKVAEFQREKALKLGIPEGPLWSRLQQGKEVKVKGKAFRPEQVMDYEKGRKGKKVSIVMDTLPSDSYFDAIKESDVLFHEAAFLEKHISRAKETRHSTAKQAAWVAQQTNAKKLVIVHISPRYKKNEDVENEARQEFGNVVVPKDLEKIEA
ncbi:MAG: ribonuclease Z [Candidatus Diapherotrites archaeon]|uniref:Ribonuclease Z n=1 Tax=Candidatus Iainarchaeum sp. TaxID=3101447 RepID=A0A939C6T0_9ARCH|nr:ribonuclease Z [Candidatus Diapherotrites archaeon]